jgi:hypothetical protein
MPMPTPTAAAPSSSRRRSRASSRRWFFLRLDLLALLLGDLVGHHRGRFLGLFCVFSLHRLAGLLARIFRPLDRLLGRVPFRLLGGFFRRRLFGCRFVRCGFFRRRLLGGGLVGRLLFRRRLFRGLIHGGLFSGRLFFSRPSRLRLFVGRHGLLCDRLLVGRLFLGGGLFGSRFFCRNFLGRCLLRRFFRCRLFRSRLLGLRCFLRGCRLFLGGLLCCWLFRLGSRLGGCLFGCRLAAALFQADRIARVCGAVHSVFLRKRAMRHG